jgi:hypothetical protein
MVESPRMRTFKPHGRPPRQRPRSRRSIGPPPQCKEANRPVRQRSRERPSLSRARPDALPFGQSGARSSGGRERSLDGRVVVRGEPISFGSSLIWLRGGLRSLERSLSVGRLLPRPEPRVATQLRCGTGSKFPIQLSPRTGAANCPAVHGSWVHQSHLTPRSSAPSDPGVAKPQRLSQARGRRRSAGASRGR